MCRRQPLSLTFVLHSKEQSVRWVHRLLMERTVLSRAADGCVACMLLPERKERALIGCVCMYVVLYSEASASEAIIKYNLKNTILNNTIQ